MKTIQQLIEAAYEKRKVEVRFKINIDGQEVPCMLSAIEYSDILKVQNKIYIREMAKAESEGLDKLPISESDWKKELDGVSAETRKVMEKPANAAEQHAKKISWYETILDIMPEHLKQDKPGNPPLLNNPEEIALFKKLIKADGKLFGTLTEAWSKLNEMKKEINDSVKK